MHLFLQPSSVLLFLLQLFKFQLQLKFSFVRKTFHYVKSVCIWSFSSPYFSYLQSKYFHIQSECGKIRTRIFRNTDILRTLFRNLRLEVLEKVGTSPTEILEFFFSIKMKMFILTFQKILRNTKRWLKKQCKFSSLAENVEF